MASIYELDIVFGESSFAGDKTCIATRDTVASVSLLIPQ